MTAATRAGKAYTVADYLLDRLAECGVDRIFGVPGDFTLQFLEHVDAHPAIAWTGSANELGAGYAADGYARVRGLGVVSTTFGVGELSAINAIAGAYAEHVPVLSLVGAPTTAVQAAARPTHHSLGDGDFAHTSRMFAEVTVACEQLAADTALEQIDRVLGAILAHSRPGYLSVPADIGELPCHPPSAPLPVLEETTDPAALAAFADAARAFLGGTRPVVLADILVHRSRAEEQLETLLRRGRLRYASMLWGRRVIDESHDDYIGIYTGAASASEVADEIESAERLITAGVVFTDLTSGFFSQRLSDERRIDLHTHAAIVGGERFTGVRMRDALDALADILAVAEVEPRLVRDMVPAAAPAETDDPLTQETLWQAVASALREDDVLLADQGTSFYGIAVHDMPEDVLFLGQPLWASIGWALGAAVGAAAGARGRRTVLLTGDGAAQLSVAELSTMLRLRLPVLMIVVDNDGYTVERAIHGPDRAYNDIALWDWTQLPAAFGAAAGSVQTFRAGTTRELLAALRAAADRPTATTVIQAMVGPMDIPPLLDAIAKAAASANRRSADAPS